MATALRENRFRSDTALLLIASLCSTVTLLFVGFVWRFRLQFGVWPQTRVSDPNFMCNSEKGLLQSVFPCDLHATVIYLGLAGTAALSLLAFPALLFRWSHVRPFVRAAVVASTLAFAVVFSWNRFQYLVWFLD